MLSRPTPTAIATKAMMRAVSLKYLTLGLVKVGDIVIIE